jgi:hypothetical protein
MMNENMFEEIKNIYFLILKLNNDYNIYIKDLNNEEIYSTLKKFIPSYLNFYNSNKIDSNLKLTEQQINENFSYSSYLLVITKNNNSVFKKEFVLEYLLKILLGKNYNTNKLLNFQVIKYFLENKELKKIISKTSFIFMLIDKLKISNEEEEKNISEIFFEYNIDLKNIYNNQNIIIYAIQKQINEDFLCKLFDKFIEIGGNLKDFKNQNEENILHYAYSFNFLKLVKKIEEKYPELKERTNKSGNKPCIYSKIKIEGCMKNNEKIKILNVDNLENLITNEFPKIKIKNFLISPIELNLNIEGDKLGEGGFGATYTIIIDGKEYVYKSQLVCSSNKKHLQKICDDFQESVKLGYFDYNLIENNFNNIISFPSFISENIVASCLNNLINKNICHNFVKSYSFYITTPTNKAEIISVMEKLDGNIIDIFTKFLNTKINYEDYLNIQLQILYALYILRFNNIQHNDLHLQNILYKQIKSPFLSDEQNNSIKNDYFIDGVSTQHIPFFEFYIDGIPIKIRNLGYLIKIIDFGYSYINKNINNKLYKISPKLKLPPTIYSGYTPHEFNFDIDFYTWILNFMTFINKEKYKQYYIGEKNNEQQYNHIINNAIKYNFFENLNKENLLVEPHLVYNLNSNIISNLGIYKDKLYHPTNPHKISKDILNIKFNNYNEVSKILNNEYKKCLDKLINLSSIENREKYQNFIKWSKNTFIFNFIPNYFINSESKEYLSLKTKFFDKKDVLSFDSIDKVNIGKNTQVSNFSFKMDNNSIQYINLASFNLNTNDINLIQTCCGITGPQYLENNTYCNNKNFTYTTINSSFFDIKKSLKPVLIYKDKSNIYKNKQQFINNIFSVNEKYLDLYKVLLWNNHKDYKLISYKNDFLNNYENYYDKYIYILSVAPLLYDFNNPNINEVNNLKQFWLEKENIDIFNCNPDLNKDTPNELSCKTINPGELSHAEQRNPRSILIIENNLMHFMVIEGRGSRGDGMKFSEIRDFCQKFFNNLKYVISLDGGASSHIAVKPSNFNHSIVLNPTYVNTIKDRSPYELYYPVGSIFVVEDKN